MAILENIDIDKGILQNIDIGKISYRLGFGISNTPNYTAVECNGVLMGRPWHLYLYMYMYLCLYLYLYLYFYCITLQWSALSSVGSDGPAVAFAQGELTLHCGCTSNTLFLFISHMFFILNPYIQSFSSSLFLLLFCIFFP